MKKFICVFSAIVLTLSACTFEPVFAEDIITISDVLDSTNYINYIDNYRNFYSTHVRSKLSYRSEVDKRHIFPTYYDIDCSGRVDVGDAQVFLYDYVLYITEQPEEKSANDPEYKKIYDEWIFYRVELIRHDWEIPLEGTRTKRVTEDEEILPEGGTSHPKNSLEVAQYVLYYYANGVLMNDTDGWFFYGDTLSFTAHAVKDTMWLSTWIKKKHPNFQAL